jgi:hypothetical protein
VQIYIFLIAFFFFKYIVNIAFKIITKFIIIIEDFALGEKGPRIVRFFNFFIGKQYFKYLSESQYTK